MQGAAWCLARDLYDIPDVYCYTALWYKVVALDEVVDLMVPTPPPVYGTDADNSSAAAVYRVHSGGDLSATIYYLLFVS